MAIIHVAEQMIVAKTVGGLKFANAQGILADGDLASTAAAAKSAIDTAAAKAHVSTRGFNARGKKAIDLIGNYDSTYIGGSSALKASMVALSKAQGISPVY